MNYKSYLRLFLLTCTILLTLVRYTQAQKMFYKGYVVTNEGDTVKGKIPYDLGTNNNYHIVDVKDEKGYVKKFNVWQIKMYSLNNELYFTKKAERGEMKHRNDLVFMHQTQTGKLTLYEYEYVRKLSGASSFEEAGLETTGEKDFYIEKTDSSFIYLPKLGYKKILKELVAEQAECISIIEDKDFDYKKIPDVIRCYNAKN
jgi:hypothetical protein